MRHRQQKQRRRQENIKSDQQRELRHKSRKHSRSRSRERSKHKKSKKQRRHSSPHEDLSKQHRQIKREQTNCDKIQQHGKELKLEECVEEEQPKAQKQLPCFEPSGILLQYYNSREGVKLKFTEPQQGAVPVQDWRIYPFKGEQSLSIFFLNADPIHLKQSCYLIGKDQRICDILCQNSSISRQHAVIQFRMIHRMNIDGTYNEVINPYVMDLQSTNGTLLNDELIEHSRYVQLLDRDILKFGLSDRQYVIVKEGQQQHEE